LTQALLSAGHDVAAIKAMMGENAIRFLLQELPQDRPNSDLNQGAYNPRALRARSAQL
jgi:hypothetical protein